MTRTGQRRRPGRRGAPVSATRQGRTFLGPVVPHPFPGRVVRAGETDRAVVRTVQRRLNQVGCGPLDEDGVFGPDTSGAVRLFQARFPDADGQPLRVDGLIGAVTWAALFGRAAVRVAARAASPLLAEALRVAAAEIGALEQPLGSNRGPQVDGYLRRVGLDPRRGSFAWCAAFVYFCFARAAETIGVENPLIKTAGVLDHWMRAGAAGVRRISAAEAHLHEDLVRPGQIFILDTPPPGGGGHTGLVERVEAGKLITIEGNTNDGGSREGVGVFRRSGRRIRDINVGFLDYGG